MRPLLVAMAIPLLVGACAVYPDGTIGPLPPVPPPGIYAPPPGPPVGYAPPVYGYEGASPGAPIYYVPPPPPPVVVSPSIGLGFYWGPRGYYGGRGYWGRPYSHGRRW
jgi:hypothetical protein